MRTTVNVSDDLLHAAKAAAARTGRSLGDVVDDALRFLLADRAPDRGRDRVVLPTDGGSGLQPGVDLEDREAIAELLDDDRAAR